MKWIVALMLVVGLRSVALADDPAITANFTAQQHLPSNTPIELRLNRPLESTEGRLALFVDKTDVTALFTALPGRLVYQGERYPLPAGEHEVIVYLVSPEGSWKEIGRFPDTSRLLEVDHRSRCRSHGERTARRDPST
ncbi:MAG TPA: hypothetical protein VNM92_10260 [Thermoanaerobaculia bacterium]|nr:hypothetical protein [Thermoanaerobaculia bacterium]